MTKRPYILVIKRPSKANKRKACQEAQQEIDYVLSQYQMARTTKKASL